MDRATITVHVAHRRYQPLLLDLGCHPLSQLQVYGHRLFDEEWQLPIQDQLFGPAMRERRQHDIDGIKLHLIKHLLGVSKDIPGPTGLIALLFYRLRVQITPSGKLYVLEIRQAVLEMLPNNITTAEESQPNNICHCTASVVGKPIDTCR